MKIVISVVTVIVIAAVIVFFTTAQNNATPQISQGDFQALMASANKPLLLDVRTPKEFAEGHVPNAINISHDEMGKRFTELGADKSQEIVVYCRSGKRAAFAEAVLREAGFTNLKHLEGDMLGWQKAGLKTEI